MNIKVSDEAVKKIGDEVIDLVTSFRHYRDKEAAKEREQGVQFIKLGSIDIEKALSPDNLEVEMTEHLSRLVGYIGYTLHLVGGEPLFERVMDYIENDPRDKEVYASVLFARQSDPALRYIPEDWDKKIKDAENTESP